MGGIAIVCMISGGNIVKVGECMNEMLKLCIGQGYVPADCKLNGMLVWLLINEGKNPCEGCNADCVHSSKYKNYIKERDKYKKEELEHRERIEKRKSLGTNSEAIIYVDTDYDSALITAIEPNSEKGYSLRCKGADEASYYIEIMCSQHKARQVIIPLNGWGIAIYDCLKKRNLKNIDIVPIRCIGEKLNNWR